MKNTEIPKIYDDILKMIATHQFQIIGFNEKNKKFESIGTCVLLKLENRYFIITAGHVINTRHNVQNNELWLLNYNDKSKTKITEDIIVDSSNKIPDCHDIALLEINKKDYPTIIEEQYLTLNELVVNEKDIHSSDKEIFIISGYTSSKNKTDGKPKLFNFLTNINYDNKDIMNNHILNQHTTIHLDYDNLKLDDKEAKLPKPQGMSGGGVWLLSKDKSIKFPSLYGISISYYSSRKIVVAVKIDFVLSMIQGYFKGTILDNINFKYIINEETSELKIIL